jgi:hypothetical protein
MAAIEEVVRRKLAPYEPRFRKVIDSAWAQYSGMPQRHKFLFLRTRANIVFDFIVSGLFVEFDGDPDVRMIQKNETLKILVAGDILIRVKKANGLGLGSNIPTQEVQRFIWQEPEIPGLLRELHKIEICYFEDLTGAEIASVQATARDNDVKLWSYEIDRDKSGVAGAIIPFLRGTANFIPEPPEVTPKSQEETIKREMS